MFRNVVDYELLDTFRCLLELLEFHSTDISEIRGASSGANHFRAEYPKISEHV